MFNEKEIEALRVEVEELREVLRQSEEKRNAQYTDIILAIRELKDALHTHDELDADWGDDELDEWYEKAREFVVATGKVSTSLLQRRFNLGYGRAARLMDQLEEQGVIEGSDGTNRPRKVLVTEPTD